MHHYGYIQTYYTYKPTADYKLRNTIEERLMCERM